MTDDAEKSWHPAQDGGWCSFNQCKIVLDETAVSHTSRCNKGPRHELNTLLENGTIRTHGPQSPGRTTRPPHLLHGGRG